MQPDANQRTNFYRSAALGLHALGARDGRERFGADADARWDAFRGHLDDGDRWDLLIRDAAVNHPAAFAPRVIFELDGLTDDEPFGPRWDGADPMLWRELRTLDVPDETGDALVELARIWALAPGTIDRTLDDIKPATRLLAVGAGAVIALAGRFEGAAGFDFADQVVLLSSRPGERQLFGMAGALLGARPNALRVLDGSAPVDALRTELDDIGFAIDRVVTSNDAADADIERASALT